MRHRSLLPCLPALALFGLMVLPARADERPARRVGLHRLETPGPGRSGGWLGVSVSLRDLFGPEDGERLRSGFINRVDVRVELWPAGAKAPVARADRHAELLFDLWDERFRVQIIDRHGPKDLLAATDLQATELVTALVRFEVAQLGGIDPAQVYRLRFRADLNPLSEDLVNEVRRWLRRPPVQARGGAGDSVFGSFVSIFVNPKIEESERQISFWSQPFRVEAP